MIRDGSRYAKLKKYVIQNVSKDFISLGSSMRKVGLSPVCGVLTHAS